jgi:hypothetical protein
MFKRRIIEMESETERNEEIEELIDRCEAYFEELKRNLDYGSFSSVTIDGEHYRIMADKDILTGEYGFSLSNKEKDVYETFSQRIYEISLSHLYEKAEPFLRILDDAINNDFLVVEAHDPSAYKFGFLVFKNSGVTLHQINITRYSDFVRRNKYIKEKIQAEKDGTEYTFSSFFKWLKGTKDHQCKNKLILTLNRSQMQMWRYFYT